MKRRGAAVGVEASGVSTSAADRENVADGSRGVSAFAMPRRSGGGVRREQEARGAPAGDHGSPERLDRAALSVIVVAKVTNAVQAFLPRFRLVSGIPRGFVDNFGVGVVRSA